MKKILVAHDGSKNADKALRKAVELSKALGGSLTVIRIVPELYAAELSDRDRDAVMNTLQTEAQTAMEKIRSSLASKSTEVKTIVRQGQPAEKILETAQKMKTELLIAGSHGRHAARKFPTGSVAAKLVGHASCSVLIVR